MGSDTPLVGVAEIAAMLGVNINTVRSWRKREMMPPEEWLISHTPVWRESTIRAWVRDVETTRTTGTPRLLRAG